MLIFSEYDSPRFAYACSILLSDLDGNWRITNDRDEIKKCEGPCIVYGHEPLQKNCIFVQSNSLLWNSQVVEFDIGRGTWKDLPTIFPTSAGEIPLDIFSAIFYLISRYEEYLPFNDDALGRFPSSQSLASRYGFLRRPVIDLWRGQFQEVLLAKWPQLRFRDRVFRVMATIDVDSAFAYKHKGFVRTIGGVAGDITRLKFGNLLRRINCLSGGCDDPFETYDYIRTYTSSLNVECIFFFLLANFSKYDINVSHRSEALRARIKELSQSNVVGIHPGMASNESVSILEMEKRRLEEITGAACTVSRQHFLMLRFPETYRRLIAVGILEDYTMGFAHDVGFRAGTSRPFHWFDLESNKVSELLVHPITAMDSTLNSYLGLSPEQALEVTKEMIRDIKNCGGVFCSLFHNETLSETGTWKGWRRVWEETLRME